MQKLMVNSVLQNVQRKEREEMKKMSDQIWQQRNHFKAEVMHKFDSLQNTPRSGTDKLNQLLAAGMLISLEEKKREQALIQKRKYLSKRTKEVVKEIPEFMISFNDYRKMRWDVFVLILTIYSCFYIPFEISF